MSKDLQMAGRWALRYAALGVLVAVPALLFRLDTLWLGNSVGEWSLVELAAEGMLAVCVISFLRLARRSDADRRLAVLLAGFFACMLVRELDAMWDLVFDGLWQLLVTALAAASLGYALTDRAATLAALRRFLGAPDHRLVMVGLVVVLVFSRLFGMGGIWGEFVDLETARVVKNAVEECTELLGYCLATAGSVGFVQRRLRHLASEPAALPAADNSHRYA